MKNRTGIDFSKHILLETHLKSDNHNVDIWDLKLPTSDYTNRVRFINSCNTLTVNGDFGNWVFCREFHPSKNGFVSDGYWDGKLSMSSQQSYSKFDSDETGRLIKELIKSGLQEYGYEGKELRDAKSWFRELLKYTDDEFEYIYEAYRGYARPDFLDFEIVPIGKTRHVWLSIVYDAFDELCHRQKKIELTTPSPTDKEAG